MRDALCTGAWQMPWHDIIIAQTRAILLLGGSRGTSNHLWSHPNPRPLLVTTISVPTMLREPASNGTRKYVYAVQSICDGTRMCVYLYACARGDIHIVVKLKHGTKRRNCVISPSTPIRLALYVLPIPKRLVASIFVATANFRSECASQCASIDVVQTYIYLIRNLFMLVVELFVISELLYHNIYFAYSI